MKTFALLLTLATIPALAQSMDNMPMAFTPVPNERLGTVNFPVSCAPASQAPFNRGVALLHDFWYAEAQPQFTRITQSDPTCAMAHWGVAMSVFHQIWDRPSPDNMKVGWAQMQQALALTAGTQRERAYIAALADFYRPGPSEFPARIAAYSAAMAALYAQYPDVDTGAFYALSILAAESPDDTSLVAEHKAMTVLAPLFAKYPDNPGVDHYITHSCDNPTMAPDALAASIHYDTIAQSGPHAFHMPGHIYMRLGLWPQDIASQLGSIAAAQAAEAHGESGIMDEPHSYDFLIYAYLQSGQDAKAAAAVTQIQSTLTKLAVMPGMGASGMGGMVPRLQAKIPAFYALERRDWPTAAAIQPAPGVPVESTLVVFWARALAHGRLHQPTQARADIAAYDAAITAIKQGKRAYLVEGIGPSITRGEMLAWTLFAEGKQPEALAQMRTTADLQDKVGQDEVDIPAREMLADMLLEFNQPQQALTEYATALKLSPGRLNGLANAGRAAEDAGDKALATHYYSALLKSTSNGVDSTRPELLHARAFVNSPQLAAN